MKDLSRLGRNSSLTGLYINFTFPKYNVRYIAINDHFDTIAPNSTDSDIAGIKNWFNEFFAKDTSHKIRAVNKAKGERGERLTTNVPYGYKRDSDDPKKWVIDKEAAQVVKQIFALCMEGKGPSQIAALLEKEKVLNPTAYKQREGRKTPHQTPENEYRWHESTVAYILEYMEYTGCTVNFKTYTNSIYDKKQRETPIEKQAVFYNTHPAIIEQEVFDKVQEIRQQRHRRTKTGKSSLFSGMVYCADCGAKMRYCTTNYFEKRQDHFVCANYRSNTGSCSAHFIRAVVLEDLVWMHMKAVIFYVTRYEKHFREAMEQKLRLSSEEAIRGHRKRLAQAEKRLTELDRLFIRIYEDNVAGRITDERFSMMSKTHPAVPNALTQNDESDRVLLRTGHHGRKSEQICGTAHFSFHSTPASPIQNHTSRNYGGKNDEIQSEKRDQVLYRSPRSDHAGSGRCSARRARLV